jgi:enoyl-CoA hydratase/carnithine racemase
MDDVTTELVDRALMITLNRPDSLNALTPPMRGVIIEALDRADADDTVRSVIVTGAGRGFCAGADISRGAAAFTPPVADGEPYRDGGGTLVRRLFASTKPLIGAINGPAAGIGAAITLPMDFRLASTTAKFGFVYVRRGIGPEGTSSWLLPQVVGITRATDWMLTGRLVLPEEALSAGLVSEVVEPDSLIERAQEIAATIARETSAVSVSLTRALLWNQFAAGHLETAHELESRVVPWLAAGVDAREGVAAFVEKRPPQFEGSPSRDILSVFPWPEMEIR